MAPSPPTHYDVLGITRDADAHEVRRAWKTLVQVWHPDRFSGDEIAAAQERAATINDAYSTLRDTSRRSAYDCRLAADDRDREAAIEAARSAARAARRAPVAARRTTSPAGNVAVADVPLDQQFLDAVADMFATMRRHPRTTIASVAACVMMLVGIGVFNAVTGPTLPSSTSMPHVARVSSHDDRSLEALAEQTRAEEQATSDALAEQLAQQQADAVAQARAQAQAAPPVDQAAVGPPAATPTTKQPSARQRTAPAGGKVQQIVKPDGTRVLRIMPG